MVEKIALIMKNIFGSNPHKRYLRIIGLIIIIAIALSLNVSYNRTDGWTFGWTPAVKVEIKK